MYARAASTYRKVSLESASPARLLDELFVRLLADLDDAERLIARGDASGKGTVINHALAILSALAASLDPAVAPELCAELTRLYDFAGARLTEANVRFDAAPIAQARRVLSPLGEAFAASAGLQIRRP